tara:strand:+ start:4643 stop:5575 length:933 start_codon:yes stop_codon:yes gene_type:complete
MLSRMAQRVFWMARYLERAESTARILNTFSQLRMDLPKGTELPWKMLPDIFGSAEALIGRKDSYSESVVLEFLIARLGNPSSLRASTAMARENARTTRHLLSKELWELINELNLYAAERGEKSISRKNRFEYLIEIANRCQTINGLVMSTQIRDDAHAFFGLGQLIERVDITCRVVSVMSLAIESRSKSNPGIDSLIWASLLESLSSLNAYRQLIGPMVEPKEAVNLIVLHPSLPRSMIFCLNVMKKTFSRLRKSDDFIVRIDEITLDLDYFDADQSSPAEIAERFLILQSCSNDLYNKLSRIWSIPKHP